MRVQAAPQLEVEVEGVEGSLRDNVLLMLGIEQQKGSSALVEGRIHRLHQKATAEIRRALEPFGYYRAEVDASLSHGEAGWLARYRIEPGPQIPIAASDIVIAGEGANDAEFSRLMAASPLRSGKRLQHADYEQLKRELLRLAEERGYFDAHFIRHQLRIDLQAYQAAIVLHLDSGPRYRFGEVRFSGSHPFDVAFLSRYLNFASGDFYEHTLLSSLQRRLIGSDYFESVDIQVGREDAIAQRVPITVTLQQRPRNRYQFGLGYGTDTGARALVGHERRWLTPQGHRFGSELRLSEVRSSLTAQHITPLARPETDRLLVQGEYHLDRGGDVDSRRALLGSSIEQSRGAWSRRWGVSYQLEDYEIGLQRGDSVLLLPAVHWRSIRGYDLLGLLRGVRISVDVRGASKAMLSDTDLLQLHLEAKSVVPAGKGRLLLRGEGAATAVQTTSQLPPSLRFFAGGDYSIRGFAYRSVGPRDGSGEVVGGRHLLAGSIEYEHPLSEKWRGALFLDGGNAFDNQFIEAEKGAGFGLRRELPIGQLRIDLAQAITATNRPWRLHLTMGLEL